MVQSLEYQFSRLREMCRPGQQTWDLSPKDMNAIGLAVRVLSVIQRCDEREVWLESFVMDGGESCLKMDTDSYYGKTLLECFSESGKAIA